MENILQVNNVVKRFGGLVAVNDVSFGVEPGKIFGIIGPNGAGKTTLFNLITGVYPVTSGTVCFDGKLITGKQIHEIAAMGIARTFQQIKLLGNQTLLDNVLLGRHARIKSNFIHSILRTKSEQREEQASLEKCVEVLKFVGLAEKWNWLAGSLSYGEQRLLEIARALATDPKIVFLDEPAAGMNPFESSQLMELIFAIRESGVTPVIIEHDMKVMMGICDYMIVLDHGAFICGGDCEHVKNNPRVIEAYLGKEVDFNA